MCKIRRIRMRICHAIKITSYYGYCNSIYILKSQQLQTNEQWTIEIIVTVFKKVKKTQQTSINQCTVIQPYFCCNIHNGWDALNYFGSRQVTELSQQLAILNPTWSDFKYTSDFGFLKKCQIPSDLDAESVTSLNTENNSIGKELADDLVTDEKWRFTVSNVGPLLRWDRFQRSRLWQGVEFW